MGWSHVSSHRGSCRLGARGSRDSQEVQQLGLGRFDILSFPAARWLCPHASPSSSAPVRQLTHRRESPETQLGTCSESTDTKEAKSSQKAAGPGLGPGGSELATARPSLPPDKQQEAHPKCREEAERVRLVHRLHAGQTICHLESKTAAAGGSTLLAGGKCTHTLTSGTSLIPLSPLHTVERDSCYRSPREDTAVGKLPTLGSLAGCCHGTAMGKLVALGVLSRALLWGRSWHGGPWLGCCHGTAVGKRTAG